MAEIALRDYQRRAIDMLYEWLAKHKGNPCIEMATGAGKSIVLAELCRDAIARWPKTRILILTHVKELIQQDAEKILAVWPEAPVGIYSAGLGQKDASRQITVAGIQSAAKKACELSRYGVIDMVIVDEAHRINHKKEGQYRKMLAALEAQNPYIRIIGLTATPFRMGVGLITEGEAPIFDDIISPISIRELVEQGYLAPLRSKFTKAKISAEGVHVDRRTGDYNQKELSAAVNDLGTNDDVVREIIRRSEGRKAWLIFCVGVDHSFAIRDCLRAHGVTAETVTGETPIAERDRILSEYKAGKITALTNAEVLTTGFDYPNIDLIAFLRPTLSTGLYMQMAGRGMRLKEHAKDCLVLDFVGNVAKHGPIVDIKPLEVKEFSAEKTRKCKACGEILSASARVCPVCGYVFERAEISAPVDLHLHKEDDIMGLDRPPQKLEREIPIRFWHWYVTQSRNPKYLGKEIFCVDYQPQTLTENKMTDRFYFWYDGYTREQSLKRFYKLATDIQQNRGVDLSDCLKESGNLAFELNNIAPPKSIFVKKQRNSEYEDVVGYQWN